MWTAFPLEEHMNTIGAVEWRFNISSRNISRRQHTALILLVNTHIKSNLHRVQVTWVHGHTGLTHIPHTQPRNQHRWREYTGTQDSLTYPIPNHATNTGGVCTRAHRTHSHTPYPTTQPTQVTWVHGHTGLTHIPHTQPRNQHRWGVYTGTQDSLTYPIPNHKTNTGGVSHGHTAPTHIPHTQP
jgi:hypothetical protein